MSNTAKIAISLPKNLLQQIDHLVKEKHQSRSAIIRTAINGMIKSYIEQKALKSAKRIYSEIAKTDRKLSEEFISVSSETFLPSE